MIKVSVIIPVYNVEKYLGQCLDSICSQTLKDIEIICVDDGSTDNSLEILNRYSQNDSRIVVVSQGKNKGLSVTRNTGLAIAKGEFICFIDSDDYIDEKYLEKLYNCAVKYDCEIACCGFIRVSGNRKYKMMQFDKEEVFKTIEDKMNAAKVPEHNYVWGKIFNRRKFLDGNLVFAPYRYYEDIEITLRILNTLGNMVTVPDIYYYYRKNPNSIIHVPTTKKKQDFDWAVSELYNYAAQNNITLPEDKLFERKYFIKIFGFTLLKIYKKEFFIRVKLFGFIPLLTISR